MNETVVAVFVRNEKLLMNQRSGSRKVYAGYLMCPSGHLEAGESLDDALKREMNEELSESDLVPIVAKLVSKLKEIRII